jgi:hypothetical protein
MFSRRRRINSKRRKGTQDSLMEDAKRKVAWNMEEDWWGQTQPKQ